MWMDDKEKRIEDGTNSIIEDYNLAVKKFEPIYADIMGGKSYTDISEQECRILVDIGEILYQVYEKTFKLYCFRYYLNLVKYGQMNQHEFNTHIVLALDSGKSSGLYIENPVNIYTLAKWMAKNATPQLLVQEHQGNFIASSLSPVPSQLSRSKVDTNLIKTNAQEGHNNKKHLFDHKPEPRLYNVILNIFPHIENVVKYYCSSSGLKSYGMVTQSHLITTVDELFLKWRENNSFQFGLIIDSTNMLSEKEKQAIASLPWSIVVDLDIFSIENGLYKTFETIGKSASFITPSATDRYMFDPLHNTYWIFPLGSNHESAYLVQNPQKWRYSNTNLRSILDKYHSINTNSIRLLNLATSEADKVADIMDGFFDAYQPIDNSNSYIEIISIYNDSAFSPDRYTSNNGSKKHYHYFNITKAQFAEYIISTIGIDDKTNRLYSVPVGDGFVDIDPAIYPSLDIIYNDIKKADASDINKTDPGKFYMGEIPISWYGISNEFPIEIKQLKYLKKNMQQISGKTKSKMKIILHEPGAGGSTLLRILAYKKSEFQPTVLINQYTPDETIKEIERLYIKCQKFPICIFADSAVLSYEECKSFKDELDAAGYSHDFFYSHRNTSNIPIDLVWHQLSEFNEKEAKEFKDTLKDYIGDIPDRDRRLTNLAEIVYINDRKEERLPLIMALYAFDKDFQGIKSYINQFIVPLSNEHKNLLIYSAILDTYANECISINMFPDFMLSLPENIDNGYSIAWSTATKKLLTIVPSVGGNSIKSKHPLFSKEIIRQLIGDEKDGKVTFYKNLTKHLCQFIELTAYSPIKNSKANINLLNNIFVTKDQTVIMEADRRQFFGPIIDYILNNCEDESVKGKCVKDIFECLVNNYSENAHFHAHLGRFYGIIVRDYIKSIECAKEAINKSEYDDPLLNHIVAICIRRYIYWLINQYKREDTVNEELEKQVLDLATEASAFFEKSRTNRKPAGYISDIEMCIRLVDFYKAKMKYRNYKSIIKDLKNPYHEYYNRALSLTQIVQSTENMLFENADPRYNLSKDALRKTNTLLQDLRGTLAFWKNSIDKETDKKQLIKYRYFYIQAAQADDLSNLSSDELNSCINFIERNIDLEYNSASIFTWFNLLQHLSAKELDIKLEEADVLLRSWREKYSDKIELEYFLFIVDTLILLKGNSIMSSTISKVETTLNSYSKVFVKNTTPRRVLCSPGNHLADFKFFNKETEAEAMELEGTIDSRKENTINYNGLSVFFNPDAQSNYSNSMRGKPVRFKMFIAYKGAYAVNNSIIIEK